MSKLNGKIGIKKTQRNQRIVHEAPLDQIAEQNDDIIDILDDELLLSDSFQNLAILSRMKLENILLRMTMLTSRSE